MSYGNQFFSWKPCRYGDFRARTGMKWKIWKFCILWSILIFDIHYIHIFNKYTILYISVVNSDMPFHRFFLWYGWQNKNEHQKSKWTTECRIFISYIWHWSELWTRKNKNVFTKKRKLAWLDYNDYNTFQVWNIWDRQFMILIGSNIFY